MLDLIISDPVAWGSILGIFVVVALCSYYVWLFLTNVRDDA
ncbi:DUF3149 domain-containing protein [Agaribacter marinus]|uniref:DUF3149 domain-containing protein n=1 Tax=Agaribacter marinus TaxID=1431249 RepID=A0AA37WGU7_9ALTE|nr:DUF3149 domain-containing protein [Agaribacter marinus]GLR70606.1 hypothetical protein GCM10007852_15140 [Agaribacter marinus]